MVFEGFGRLTRTAEVEETPPSKMPGVPAFRERNRRSTGFIQRRKAGGVSLLLLPRHAEQESGSGILRVRFEPGDGRGLRRLEAARLQLGENPHRDLIIHGPRSITVLGQRGRRSHRHSGVVANR